MEMIEYRTIDKTLWARGEWDNEPDKVQWMTRNGFPGLAVRGPGGHWCGYVGVPEGHPWFEVDSDYCGMYQPKPDGYEEGWYPDVHGGLTFSGFCREEEKETGICHVPGPGEPDRVWWLGFDCAHAGDMTGMKWQAENPEVYAKLKEATRRICTDTYRTLEYVKGEVELLAAQANTVRA